MAEATRGGKKNRKHGRATRSPSGKSYKIQGRADTNKVKRMKRHIKKHPADSQAISLLH